MYIDYINSMGSFFLGGGAQRHRLILEEKLHPMIFFEREIFSGLYINISIFYINSIRVILNIIQFKISSS